MSARGPRQSRRDIASTARAGTFPRQHFTENGVFIRSSSPSMAHHEDELSEKLAYMGSWIAPGGESSFTPQESETQSGPQRQLLMNVVANTAHSTSKADSSTRLLEQQLDKTKYPMLLYLNSKDDSFAMNLAYGGTGAPRVGRQITDRSALESTRLATIPDTSPPSLAASTTQPSVPEPHETADTGTKPVLGPTSATQVVDAPSQLASSGRGATNKPLDLDDRSGADPERQENRDNPIRSPGLVTRLSIGLTRAVQDLRDRLDRLTDNGSGEDIHATRPLAKTSERHVPSIAPFEVFRQILPYRSSASRGTTSTAPIASLNDTPEGSGSDASLLSASNGQHQGTTNSAGSSQLHSSARDTRERSEGRRDDEDDFRPRKHPRRDPSDPSDRDPEEGTFGCPFRDLEPRRCISHARYKYISQLLRHLERHGLHICSKCLSTFTTKDYKRQHVCVKACKNRSCRQYCDPAHRSEMCFCITTAQEQYAAICFGLRSHDEQAQPVNFDDFDFNEDFNLDDLLEEAKAQPLQFEQTADTHANGLEAPVVFPLPQLIAMGHAVQQMQPTVAALEAQFAQQQDNAVQIEIEKLNKKLEKAHAMNRQLLKALERSGSTDFPDMKVLVEDTLRDN